jgi:hypothetical protein
LPSPGNGCAPQSRSMRPVKRRFHTRCCHAESKIVADLHVWTSRCIWGFWSFRSMFRFYLAVQNPNFNCLWSPVGFHFILISLSYTAVYTTCILVRWLIFATRSKESMLRLAFLFGL